MRISRILYYGANCAQFANIQMQSYEKTARLYGTLQPWKYWIALGCIGLNSSECTVLLLQLPNKRGENLRPENDSLAGTALAVGFLLAVCYPCVFFSWPLFLGAKFLFRHALSAITPQKLSSFVGDVVMRHQCTLNFSSECLEYSFMQHLSLWNVFLSGLILWVSTKKVDRCGSAAIFLSNGFNSFAISRWNFLKVTYTDESPPYRRISKFVFSSVFQVFERSKREFYSVDLQGNSVRLKTVLDEFCEKSKNFCFPSRLWYEVGSNPKIKSPFSLNLLLNYEVDATGFLR
ncbi:MAG: hypothetical protein SNF33_05150 [Candidatus Algichlamydia australiensis]|nr:hypothetical protein [Chlamydiales bacterium]